MTRLFFASKSYLEVRLTDNLIGVILNKNDVVSWGVTDER